MKKSILFVIGVIYILSIVAVSFYGLSIKNYHENKYPDYITLLNQTDKDNGIEVVKREEESYFDKFDIYIDLNELSSNSYKLDFALTREDGEEVNNTSLDYYLTNATEPGGLSNNVCSIEKDGTVTFFEVPGKPITAANLTVSSSAKGTVKVQIQFVIRH